MFLCKIQILGICDKKVFTSDIKLENYELSFRNDLSDEYTTEALATTNKDGYYEVWVGKSLQDSANMVWIEIYDTDGESIYSFFIDWESINPKERKDFEIR